MDKYEIRRLELVQLLNDQCNGKVVELAKRLGRSDSYVSRMLYEEGKAGRKRIGEDMAELIAETFNIKNTAHSIEKPSNVRAIHPDDPPLEDMVYVPESRITFSAGNGRTANFELIEDEEPASYRLSWFQKYGINPNRVKRFRVSGDSMEPMLFARDTILVNLDETNIIDDKLYAIRYGDELRVKYLRKKLDGTLILRSMNPSYKDEEVSPMLANEHISIIGRVRDKSGTGGL
jgi:phage repressor protein C with HTH and peptisase S24 domain